MNVSKERLGQLFILVGPGGVGKNALMNELIKKTDDLWQLPTATTRPIRPGEKEGREHQFVSLEAFRQMIDAGALIEYQEVHPGKYYGVPKQTVETAIAERQDMIADIEVLGTKIIRERYPQNSVSIFIAPPSMHVIQERLLSRNASEEDMQDRMNRLPMEMLYAPFADHLIVNDDFDAALNDMERIVSAVREGQTVNSDHMPDVRFVVSVSIICEDSQLVPDSATAVLEQSFDRAEPAHAARDLVKKLIGDPFDASYLTYGNAASKCELDYQLNAGLYQVTYHYTYTLTEKHPIEGYRWVSST